MILPPPCFIIWMVFPGLPATLSFSSVMMVIIVKQFHFSVITPQDMSPKMKAFVPTSGQIYYLKVWLHSRRLILCCLVLFLKIVIVILNVT